jgi:arabinofuranosyltransferase
MTGFYAGPDVHIIDALALADPLLARLPAKRNLSWRPGHFERAIPSGYEDTIRTGTNALADVRLARYYDHLASITRGDLLSWQRLLTIVRMNAGLYDHYIDREAYVYFDAVKLQYADVKATGLETDGMSCASAQASRFGDAGLLIELQGVLHSRMLKISLTQNARFALLYYLQGRWLATQEIPARWLNSYGWTAERAIAVAGQAAATGFDRLRVIPVDGHDTPYCLAYVRFEEAGRARTVGEQPQEQAPSGIKQ